jgi:hypothetical protein
MVWENLNDIGPSRMKLRGKLSIIGIQLRKNNQITPTFLKQNSNDGGKITHNQKQKNIIEDLIG